MCGIAGIIRREPVGSEMSTILERLAHRGPDGHGVWEGRTASGWHVCLGHRRLSIIDLAGGRQPMGNEDGTCQLTYNGELYNFQLLRQSLASRGHQFSTHSDTETIVHHLEDYGVEKLCDLSGMFAFGFWDGRSQTLTIARDRAGIKPLYYAPLPCGGIAFASELLALAACSGIDLSICDRGLASLFFRDYIEPPHTILRGVRKLEAGQSLQWNGGTFSKARTYWTLANVAPANPPFNPSELTEALASRLDAAVKAQLAADVPLGIFLSGGIDSSLVAAVARKHIGPSLHTFSIGFDDPQYDESPFARQVASHLGTRHIEHCFGESDLLGVLDSALNALDEPMADPSLLPTFLLSRLAAQHVKVALGGDGGDELWAGYPTYRAHRMAALYSKTPQCLRNGVIRPLVSALPVRHGYQTLEWKLKRFVCRFEASPLERHQAWMSNVLPADLDRAMAAGVPWLEPGPQPGSADRDLVNQILALDFRTYMPGSILTKVDRASMANGLEVRPPLLDNSLIDFAFSLPSKLKLNGKQGKWLLKKVAAPLLPGSILRRKKKGFGIPLSRWIGTALEDRIRSVLSHSPIWSDSLLSRSIFRQWLDEHISRRFDHSRPLWTLLVLDHFYRRLRTSTSMPAIGNAADAQR